MENKDTRPFDIELAKSGQKVGIEGLKGNVRIICTDRIGSHPIVVLVSEYNPDYLFYGKDQIFCFNIRGERKGGAKLVILPSGTVKGKSVFVGDKVIGAGGGEVVVTSQMRQSDFDKCSLVESKDVLETRMSEDELIDAYCQAKAVRSVDSYRAIANAAINRAIAYGDVIPRSIVKELMIKVSDCPNSLVDYALNDYLEGLKK